MLATTQSRRFDPTLLGTLYSVLSALAYTGANLALRQLAEKHHGNFDWEVWVSCMKAVPAALAAWLVIAYRGWNGLPALPPRQLLLPLFVTGLFMQFAGNVLFQRALSLGGLALTMPLMFATLILGSALLERILFAEPITRRSLWAMTALIASIVALQAGSGQATAAVTGDVSALVSIAAMIAAGVSGIAYAACNVVIRRTIRGTVSLSATLVLMSTSGVVGLGIVSLVRSGPAQLLSTSSADLAIMLLAGSFNAAAFFALGESLRHITVLRLNLLNSSQIAMASVGGVLLFDERMTGWLIAGTALTVVGLLLIDRPQREQPSDRD